jgi:hypothetical protein
VVYLLFTIVVPQLAYVTVIARSLCMAVAAIIACSLRCSTHHAKHMLGELPVQIVVFGCIVTVPTGVPVMALETLHLHVALVMLATKSQWCPRCVVVFLFAVVRSAMLGLRAIRGVDIAWSQAVWVIRIDVRRG